MSAAVMGGTPMPRPAIALVTPTPRRCNLQLRAERLWPDNQAMQREWIRAVAVVRSTRRGWLLERPVAPKEL